MRLSSSQIQTIRKTAQRVLGGDVSVRVFGSRVNDTAKGGDIDLFFETEKKLDNRAKVICRLSGALTLALGDRKIDIVLKDANTPNAPIFDIAKRTGVQI